MKNPIRVNNLNVNKHLVSLLYLFLVGNYFFLIAMITMVNVLNMSKVPLFFVNLERSAFCGMMTTMIMVTFVMLTVFYYKKGFITSCILYVFFILYTAGAAGKAADSSALTGLFIITIGYITCIIIFHNLKNLTKKNEMLQLQKNMLNKMAYYDSLTNLPNRHRILSEITTTLKNLTPATGSLSLIRIDIDNYRILLDYLGHSKAEAEMSLFSQRLKAAIHPLDMPGRMDSNEFIVLVERPLSQEELRGYVLHLQQELSSKITHNHNSFFLNINLGISVYPKHGTNTEELLQYADTACYEAKKNTKNHICFFNHELYDKLVYKTQIENALKEAIHKNELYLVYQPQYSADTKKLRGFETLLRWNHSESGLISPAIFIPIAEETSTILSIGKWVLEQACYSFAGLIKQFHTRLILSVNISVVQLLENSFLDTVTEILDKAGFPPDLLEFEITETVMISSKETVIRILNELKRMGIHIALDDFGTEYASLSYLQLLPLDIIKIDRSFISSIDEKNTDNLVEAIITIAKQQSLVTVAEGIENEQQLNYLKDKGCQYIQGFLWGKPIEQTGLITLLTKLEQQQSLPK